MGFEKQALQGFLEAMCSERFETDYPLQGLKIDFFFAHSRLGICYDGAGESVIAKATRNKRIAGYLKRNSITLVPLEIGDVCKDGLLKKVPQICNKRRIAENSDAIHLAMTRLIKGIMAEISEEPEINEWNTKPPDYDPAEESIDLPEESLELQAEVQQDTIDLGESEDGNQTSNPTNQIRKIKAQEANPQV